MPSHTSLAGSDTLPGSTGKRLESIILPATPTRVLLCNYFGIVTTPYYFADHLSPRHCDLEKQCWCANVIHA